MLISLQSHKWSRATENIRPGSLIEYEYYTDNLGYKTARALALVVRVARVGSVAKSYVEVVSPAPDSHLRVSMSHVCQIIVI